MAASAALTGLAGRRAIVVGASSGVGLAVTRALVGAGMRVDAAARRSDAISAAADAASVTSHRVDITDRAAVQRWCEHLAATGPIHALVVAAGANVPHRRFDRLSPDDWDDLLATNLTGAFDVLRGLLGPLRETRGVAIVIGSVSATWPDESGAAYQASKAGVLAMARAVALEERGHGLRVTTLLPGAINTALLDRRPEPPPAELRAQMLTPEDVAATCLFVLSLPPRVSIPELTILPTALQTLGATSGSGPRPSSHDT